MPDPSIPHVKALLLKAFTPATETRSFSFTADQTTQFLTFLSRDTTKGLGLVVGVKEDTLVYDGVQRMVSVLLALLVYYRMLHGARTPERKTYREGLKRILFKKNVLRFSARNGAEQAYLNSLCTPASALAKQGIRSNGTLFLENAVAGIERLFHQDLGGRPARIEAFLNNCLQAPVVVVWYPTLAHARPFFMATHTPSVPYTVSQGLRGSWIGRTNPTKDQLHRWDRVGEALNNLGKTARCFAGLDTVDRLVIAMARVRFSRPKDATIGENQTVSWLNDHPTRWAGASGQAAEPLLDAIETSCKILIGTQDNCLVHGKANIHVYAARQMLGQQPDLMRAAMLSAVPEPLHAIVLDALFPLVLIQSLAPREGGQTRTSALQMAARNVVELAQNPKLTANINHFEKAVRGEVLKVLKSKAHHFWRSIRQDTTQDSLNFHGGTKAERQRLWPNRARMLRVLDGHPAIRAMNDVDALRALATAMKHSYRSDFLQHTRPESWQDRIVAKNQAVLRKRTPIVPKMPSRSFLAAVRAS